MVTQRSRERPTVAPVVTSSTPTPDGPLPLDGPRMEGWLCGQADALGACAAVVALLSDDGTALEPRWSIGYPEEVVLPSPSHVEHSAQLPTGATVLLYTDGLVERRGESLDTGFARLAATAESVRHLPPAQLLDGVLARLRDHAGPVDDIAVVAAMPLTV